MLIDPMSAGRHFDEILRLPDALQLDVDCDMSPPAGWKTGENVIIPTSVADEEAKQKHPQRFRTWKPYLQIVSQPR